ncbi:MAG: hypothetical protein ACLGJD_02120 [Gammaproteobacteria bacterium]
MILTPPFAELYSAARASLRYVFDAQGQLVEVPNDTLGLTYDPDTLRPRGLAIEPQRTNAVRNPRGEGAAAGVFPTNWQLAGSQNGVLRTCTGAGTMLGLTSTLVRFAGTASGTVNYTATFEVPTSTTITAQDTHTLSAFLRLAAGSLSGFSDLRLSISYYDSGNAFVGSVSISLSEVLSDKAQRFFCVGIAPATATYARIGLQPMVSSGGVVDVTVEVGVPQFEMGGYPTTPMLPPTGNLGAATRLADAVSINDLGRIGFSPQGHTFLIRGRIDSMPVNSFISLLQLRDASSANQLSCRIATDGRINFRTTVDGVNTDLSSAPGSIAAGADFSVAITFGPGVQRLSVGGAAAVEAQPPGLPAGMSRLLLGSQSSGTSNLLGGTIAQLHTEPGTLSLADIQALSAAA